MTTFRWSPMRAGKLTDCPICGQTFEDEPDESGGYRPRHWRWRWTDGDPAAAVKVCAGHLETWLWGRELGQLTWPSEVSRRDVASSDVVTFTWHADDYEGCTGQPTHDEAARIEEISALVYPLEETEVDDLDWQASFHHQHAA